MITDRIENLPSYHIPGQVCEKILSFANRVRTENLPDGRYELDGDNLFALVQRYATRPDSEERFMESHQDYDDLQAIVSGTEEIDWALTDMLDVRDAYDPARDIMFYRRCRSSSRTLLEAGMFAYFAPQDAHLPCLTPAGMPEQQIEKIVFKIKATK